MSSIDAGFCVEALKETLADDGTPEMFNTDQGSQFTSTAFTDVRHDAKVTFSLDGRGRGLDSRMIARLWRSLKSECVYLNACESGSETGHGTGAWIACCNNRRPHASHGMLTPDEADGRRTPNLKIAA